MKLFDDSTMSSERLQAASAAAGFTAHAIAPTGQVIITQHECRTEQEYGHSNSSSSIIGLVPFAAVLCFIIFVGKNP